jgi:hypothetical protein
MICHRLLPATSSHYSLQRNQWCGHRFPSRALGKTLRNPRRRLNRQKRAIGKTSLRLASATDSSIYCSPVTNKDTLAAIEETPSPTRRRAAALLGYDTDGNLLMIGGYQRIRHDDIRADGEFQQRGEL